MRGFGTIPFVTEPIVSIVPRYMSLSIFDTRLQTIKIKYGKIVQNDKIERFTLLCPGIIDIGIEFGETVCSWHHTVCEEPFSLRGVLDNPERDALRYVQ